MKYTKIPSNKKIPLPLGKLQENSYKVNDKDKRRTISFTYIELKKIADIKYRGNKRFSEMLEEFTENILSIREKIEIIKGRKTIFNIFSKIEIDDNNHILSITVNKDFEHFLFEVNDCYSNLNINEYIEIKSNHTKGLYKFINQWKSLGMKEIEIEAFKNLFEIPKSYEMCHLTEKIIKPAVKELNKYFPGLSFQKVKSGRKICKIIFTWQKIEPIKKIYISSKIKVNKIKNKEQNKSNFPTIEEKLNTLNKKMELETFIKTNLSEKIIIKPVKKITANEYEIMYQNYLKINKVESNLFIRKGFDNMNKGKYEIIKL